MSNRLPPEGNNPPPNYDYFFDGLVRRQLHEFGATGFEFYKAAFKGMDYKRGEIALDIGAGMGHDGLLIAETYHPAVVFLLEPPTSNKEDFDDKYVALSDEITLRGLSTLKLLPSPASKDPYVVPAFDVPGEQITYIQPIPGVAESIPLPNKSVKKSSLIHVAPELSDLHQSLSEVARVMAPGGMGLLVTNGEGDKREFKKILAATPAELSAEVGEEINVVARTVSSSLNYLMARTLLKQYFRDVRLFTYQDQMIINEPRLDYYIYAYDSYRRLFDRDIVTDGPWRNVRERLVYDPIRAEMSANNGIFRDTIDIGAIYFSNPL